MGRSFEVTYKDTLFLSGGNGSSGGGGGGGSGGAGGGGGSAGGSKALIYSFAFVFIY